MAVAELPFQGILHLGRDTLGDVTTNWTSPLLLQLSRMFRTMHLVVHNKDKGIHARNFPRFLEAAVRLRRIQLLTVSELDAGYASYLLCCCSQVTEVSVFGKHLPQIYPTSMETLQLSDCWEPRYHDTPDWVNTLLLHLAALPSRLQCLRKVDIRGVDCLLLTAEVQLPLLVELCVSVTAPAVYEDDEDSFGWNSFAWLQAQCCSRLVLEVDLESTDELTCQEVIASLQRLTLHSLVLICCDLMPLEVQQMWEDFKQPSLVRRELIFCSEYLYGKEPEMLHTLPFWDQLTFGMERTFLQLSWADLTCRGGTVIIEGLCFHHLHILGCEASMPEPWWPWQLLVKGGVAVSGADLLAVQVLTVGSADSRAKHPTLRLQNRAAVAAGW